MGTRGVFGVHVNGVSKLMYNHSDSYPSWLGTKVLNDVKVLINENGIDWVKDRAAALRCVSGNSSPSKEDKDVLATYSDIAVGNQSEDDWYCLTRNLQGDLVNVLQVGLMLCSENFIADSLFCEWGYVLNLDDNRLEVYKGFQQKPHDLGRYASLEKQGDYYPCALLCYYHLDNLPDPDEFCENIRAFVYSFSSGASNPQD